MDVIMVGPWQCRKHVDHGRHHAWAMDALFSSEQKTMDVIMLGPWILFSQNGLDYGRHHGWAMDALF